MDAFLHRMYVAATALYLHTLLGATEGMLSCSMPSLLNIFEHFSD